MIIIFGAIAITILIIFYTIFDMAVKYAVNPTTTYMLVWLFTLFALNIIATIAIYGYYYYKTQIHPFQGSIGTPGYKGSDGNYGINTTEYICKNTTT